MALLLGSLSVGILPIPIQPVSIGEQPDAVCLDGTPASYYFYKNPLAPAVGAIWSISLMRSSDCFNQTTCAWRCTAEKELAIEHCNIPYPSRAFPELNRTHGFPTYMANEHQAHVAIAPPCVADAFLGNAEAWGQYFRGASVLKAMINDLKNQGLGSSGGPELIVLHGASAGARGAMLHLDHVKDYLDPDIREQVSVVGVIDSVASSLRCYPGTKCDTFVDGLPDHTRLLDQSQQMISDMGIEDWLLGDACVKANPDQTARCLFFDYALRHIKTPLFQMIDLNDKFMLKQLHGGEVPTVYKGSTGSTTPITASPEDAVTAAGMGQIMLRNARLANDGPSNGLFAANCYDHAVSMEVSFFQQSANGTNATDAFNTWLSGGTGSGWRHGPGSPNGSSLVFREWVDSCKGFCCGGGCLQDCSGACKEPPPAHVGEGGKGLSGARAILPTSIA